MTPDRRTMFLNVQHPGKDGSPLAAYQHFSGADLGRGRAPAPSLSRVRTAASSDSETRAILAALLLGHRNR